MINDFWSSLNEEYSQILQKKQFGPSLSYNMPMKNGIFMSQCNVN